MAETVADQEMLDKSVALLREPATPQDLQITVCAMFTACATHSAELAQRILDAGSVTRLITLLQPTSHSDTKVQASALRCLAHLSSHDAAGAGIVAHAGAGPAAIRHATALDPTLRRSAASLLHQLAARTPELCTAVASEGCVTALISALRADHGTQHALAPLMALGHIGSCAATFARVVRIYDINTAVALSVRACV